MVWNNQLGEGLFAAKDNMTALSTLHIKAGLLKGFDAFATGNAG